MPTQTGQMGPDAQFSRGKYSLWLGIVILIIVALVAWFGYNTIRSQSVVDQQLREQFAWSLMPAQPDPTTPGPRTAISLEISDVNVDVGTYPGNCTVIDGKSAALLVDELSAVVCKQDTTGVEIGIFRNDTGELVLKKGDLDSSSMRGENFVPLVKQS